MTGGGGTPTGTGGQRFNPEYADQEIAIGVRAPLGEGTIAEPNRVTIAGGGALGVAGTRDPITVDSKPTPFGIANGNAWFSNEDGTIDTQAGSHPYEATFITDYNMHYPGSYPPAQPAGGDPRNLTFNLPPGLVGDPYAVPRCTLAQFNIQVCPPASQVGILSAEVDGEEFFGGGQAVNGQPVYLQDATPVYNLVPPAGEPAELGFSFVGIPTFIGTQVRSGSNYSLRSQVNNIPTGGVVGNVLTLWGEPSNPSHDRWRIGGSPRIPEKPFLTLPTSCEGPQEFSLSVNSWEHPSEFANASFLSHDANDEPTGFTGCEFLGFNQTLAAEPDTSNADTPGGVTAGIKSQVGAIESPGGLADTDLKHVTFKLPAGVSINPGQGAGLQACQFSESGIGVEGTSAEPTSPGATMPEPRKSGPTKRNCRSCGHPLRGSIYVLPSEPPHLLLLFALAGEGVSAKLIGRVDMEEERAG